MNCFFGKTSKLVAVTHFTDSAVSASLASLLRARRFLADLLLKNLLANHQ